MTGFNRPLRRKTEATRYNRGRATPIVIEIPAGGRTVGLRLAKSRKVYYLPTADLLCWAITAHSQAEKRRRKEERKARKR